MAMLRACATGPQAVLVDVTDACLDRPLMVDRRVQFHGLHYRADGADLTGLAEIIVAMIAEMAGISRKFGGVLSRLSVGDVDLTDGDGRPAQFAPGCPDDQRGRGRSVHPVSLSAARADRVAESHHLAACGLVS